MAKRAHNCSTSITTNQQQQPILTSFHPASLKHRNVMLYFGQYFFVAPFIVLSGLNWLQPQLLYAANLSFYQAASLVFGGGHVILPLLHQDFVSTGLVSAEQFDLGYAVAQLVAGHCSSFWITLGRLIRMTNQCC